MARIVIPENALPMRLPVWPTTTLWLLLDRLNVTGVAFGVIATLWSLLVAMVIVAKWQEKKKPLPGYGVEP